MRADDVSAEDLQQRLFQLGPEFKHHLKEFLLIW
jgi:hypothetical protein